MKKQLIAVGLAGLLAMPTISFGEEMAGASLYGSFRAGLKFGAGDAEVNSYVSRWGIKGSYEVAEGLTAAYKYEATINVANAETAGGAGHNHAAVPGSDAIDAIAKILGTEFHEFAEEVASINFPDGTTGEKDNSPDAIDPENYVPGTTMLDTDEDGYAELIELTDTAGDNTYTFATQTVVTPGENDDPATTAVTYYQVLDTTTTHGHDAVAAVPKGKNTAAIDADGGPGGRLSYVSLSGGFGTITVGQIWSASYNHYGAALDPTWFNGSAGGANTRNANSVSYSSSAGDVSFQIDKVTGKAEKLEFGATAALGPMGVGLGYWSNENDEASFTGVAFSAGAGGVGLAVGLGSTDDAMTGKGSDTSIISVSGALGDSGISYGVQVTNSDDDTSDQNLVSLVNSLGAGAAIHFEHLDPGSGKASSHLALRVDF